ncbi:nucleoside hydrolase [Amycolatopsis sp. H20-H5]|uniref:nucleoside hydrolase n=1 Tax=Amycolatopsis sp. H20-H5 TaxID=3046309 RepID=UPI002DBB0F6E|nr:nucleoside hydrolase [Amycolatopsis sp. H20-H5]MEC3977729.1 nucleoside hydrolase [Amycolatopsis sp. H20-H5]
MKNVANVRTVLVAVLITTGSAVAPAFGQGNAAPAHPNPVVYDSDMDFDDSATLAYLCEEHKRGLVDLLAVTVDNNGMGKPGRALQHAHSVLNECGLPNVPVADGSNTIVHPAPASTVQHIETILTAALGDGSVPPTVPSSSSAAQLITRTIAATPAKVTVLATGPLSNLATALRDAGRTGRNRLADRIRGLYVMGGAISVRGNLFGRALDGFDNSQEFNMWLDPTSAKMVFHAMPSGVTHLVPLDATNDVPITPSFIDKLGADQQTVTARLVYRIMTQPAMTKNITAGYYSWWDALAALSALRNNTGIAHFQSRQITVVRGGVQSGRTELSPSGACTLVALAADQGLFERIFLNALNGR